jgi:50S ribosomal subunit-associated GTPase HflX
MPVDEVAAYIPASIPLIRVTNKIDLMPQLAGDPARKVDYYVSALTGQGIAVLLDAIAGALVPSPPTAGAAVAFTPDHVASLERAASAIERRDTEAATAALQSLLS